MTLRIVAALFICLEISACSPRSREAPTALLGRVPDPDGKIPVPKALSPQEFCIFGRSLSGEASHVIARLGGVDRQANLGLVLVKTIKKFNGIPREQIGSTLSTLVRPESTACGGLSCAPIFGLYGDEIDDFLDNLYRRMAKDETLLKSENDSLRKIYLGSLKRGPDETVPPPKSSAVRVLYRLAKLAGESGVTISDPNFHFMIDLYPGDLRRAHRLVCSDTECQAEILKPVHLNVNLPLALDSHLIVRYRIGTDHASGHIHHEAVVGGRLTPISVGSILSVSFDFWAEMEKSTRTSYRPVIRKFDCSASVYCNMPILTVGAIFNREGIAFDQYINSSVHLTKFTDVSPVLPGQAPLLPYSAVHEKVKKILGMIDSGSLGVPPALSPDIRWDDFSGPRHRN